MPFSKLLELLFLVSRSTLCIRAGKLLNASHLGLNGSSLCLLGSSVLLLSILKSLLQKSTVLGCLALASKYNVVALLLSIGDSLDSVLVLLLLNLSFSLSLLLESTLTTLKDCLSALTLASLALLIR